MMLDGARHPGAPRHGLLRRRGGLLLARRSSCAAETCTPGSRRTSDGTGFAGARPDAAGRCAARPDEPFVPVARLVSARPRDRVLLRPARSSASTPLDQVGAVESVRESLSDAAARARRAAADRRATWLAATHGGRAPRRRGRWLAARARLARRRRRPHVRRDPRPTSPLRRLLVAPARTARAPRSPPAEVARLLRRGGSRRRARTPRPSCRSTARARSGASSARPGCRARAPRARAANSQARVAVCGAGSATLTAGFLQVFAALPLGGEGFRYRVARAATTVMSSSWGRPASKASTASTIRWQSVPDGRAGVVAEQFLEPRPRRTPPRTAFAASVTPSVKTIRRSPGESAVVAWR